MVSGQHLTYIQWYFNFLGLTLVQLEAVCNPTEDLIYLFIICPSVVLSSLTLKTLTWKDKDLFTIITQKDKGASLTLLQVKELLKNLQQNLRHCQDFHISTWYVYRPRTFTPSDFVRLRRQSCVKELFLFVKEHL